MSGEGNRESLERIMAVCSETQSMIDIAAKQLYGLRQCRESGELIKKEIWESESKLICLFGKLIVTKAKTKNQSQLSEYPKTEQWLDIVGIDPNLSKKIIKKLSLMKMLDTKDQLEKEMKRFGASDEEVRTLTTAVKNLKLWIDFQSQETRPAYVNGNWSTADLHWSNFKSTSMATGGSSPYLGNSPKLQNSHHHHQQRPSTSSLPGGPTAGSGTEPVGIPPAGQRSPWVSNSQLDVNEQDRSQIVAAAAVPSLAGYADMQLPSYSTSRMTPPTTPLVPKTQKGGKFPTTPPPKRRNKLNLDSFKPLIKSTSHESQLSLKVAQDSKYSKKKPSNINIVGSSEAISNSSPMRKRSSGTLEDGTGTSVATSGVGSTVGRVSGQSSPLNSSPYRSPQLGKAIVDEVTGQETGFRMNQLVVPPVSPGMNNSFNHKFQSKLVLSTCDSCRKQLIRGRVCKNCRLKFHNDCVSRAPSICEYYHSSIPKDEDPTDLYYGQRHPHQPQQPSRRQQQPQLQHFDSSSTASSCNSSSPSSPAHPISSASGHWASQQLNCNNAMHFTYPEPKTLTESSSGIGSSLSSNSTPTVSVSAADAVNTSTSTDSDKSEKTITGSGDSSGDQNLNLDHLDSVDSSEDANSSANLHRDNSISVALKEWDIPYEELKFHEIIGVGRFGTVHKGDWHGEVAIKVLNTDPSADNQAQQLHAFKLEVANLKKTRHENLVLFMGACMEPQRLAIVTSFVKGITLFNKLHVRKEKFLINQTIAIASQIAQGLGYLHAKGIVHKDLKTKNVFVENLKPSSSSSENFKVVISDFGLFSVSKLCHGSRKGRWLCIPFGWLWYLSPEIVRSLTSMSPFETDLPFTRESDIYAFGTVWHELLSGEWPLRSQHPESIIWRIGKGAIQHHLNAQAEFKEILMKCWAFRAEDRPNCQQVLKILERLPRKRLARSPSHPIQLSRSAESIF